jgi:predicted HD superfamily hydrolase involved in NAD metabolism
MWFDLYSPIVSRRMSRHRFLHSLGVMHTAMALADRFGASVESAGIAGLLHDACKEVRPEVLRETLKRAGWKLTPLDDTFSRIFHAWAGEVYAADHLGVTDPDILEAIRYHPTGHPDMGMLARIIFLADTIEPTRRQRDDLKRIRALAHEDLDRAVLAALRDKTAYVGAKGGASRVHPWSTAAREAFDERADRAARAASSAASGASGASASGHLSS